jgi:hypothetical protein
MRKRRIGSDVCIGGYQLSVQEVLDLDRNTDTSGMSKFTATKLDVSKSME